MTERRRKGGALFDYDSEHRGTMATLSYQHYTVTLVEYPQSLLDMLEAGVLTGQALKDAEALELELARVAGKGENG